MSPEQQDKISDLIEKYNDILMNSMRLAIAEDFINLLILNRDDTNFELKELLTDKERYYQYILKEFLRINSSPVASALRKMKDPEIPSIRRTKNSKKR
jgi:hypothetical protein